jgi:hypothetical protein
MYFRLNVVVINMWQCMLMSGPAVVHGPHSCTCFTIMHQCVGPRVFMGVAWSGINQNLGLQARVVPACCTEGPHCKTPSLMRLMASKCMHGKFMFMDLISKVCSCSLDVIRDASSRSTLMHAFQRVASHCGDIASASHEHPAGKPRYKKIMDATKRTAVRNRKQALIKDDYPRRRTLTSSHC